ncbi:TMEM165/GDT1 family protein [Thermosulfuriphilus ammonigenes]|uniref:GDT1 family protein n=1 Tax=Thermosulfuriphilus ammonigenes TaxID=1936021 RepID=A0A6G7PW07_9BACT|nr:TMEM165/GDT1 family protein [Thermosulfuriphilus ammonigenes]MBA2847968.1 putative Ca2+/H+ antiporter (TMEM165/GDT1 family) [Thermosulfuriphilus ammonigenes]QIJ71842.1 TMEM165/GDT1 family protein [Thermosulfuriphilus ammonigenes]
MDLRLFISVFVAIFLAELGDKTQLATMSLSAADHRRWTIFLAASSALVLSSLLGVLLGGLIGQVIPFNMVKIGAGILFILIGIAMILGKL